MKVRPIFWYMLTAVLSLALFLGAWGNWQSAEAVRRGSASDSEQEYGVMAEKTNTALFLETLAVQTKSLDTELLLFTTTAVSDQAGFSCQISAQGAYNDLAQLLSWLEKQPCVDCVQQFDLKAGADGVMQLDAELILG